MELKKINTNQNNILNEIIETVSELPLENQEVLVLIAKSMQYTRNCISSKNQQVVHN